MRLELPTIQNWSCHNCSGCCRQHLIEITEEERQRIESQNWTEADGIPAGRPLAVWHAGPFWNKRYRLAHQPDGACVFLDERGLCRIHAKFGEAAKPLPCRIYPYAFHPAGKKVAVSLRFSCPSVARNQGRPVSQQSSDLQAIARAVVPSGGEPAPPLLNASQRVEWPDFLKFVSALDATLADTGTPLLVRLLRALFWIYVVDQAQFDKIRGARLGEFLDLIRQAAEAEVAADPGTLGEPSRAGAMQFRMLVAQYARRDTGADLDAGWRGRWRLLRAAWRFAQGLGNVPVLHDDLVEVPFAALEEPFGGLPAEADELLTRYFRVKVQGIHFCGPAYYDVPLAEGFQSLALVYPAVLWLARWQAAGAGRRALTLDDVARAVSVADHHHGYSPAFGRSSFRRRVRLLAGSGDLPKLCAWYNR